MMEKVILDAEIREEKGKGKVKLLRRSDVIPAVVYKGGKEAVSIKVDKKALYQTLHTGAGENVLITLMIKGDKKAKEKTCIIKEVQRDPVKEDIIHVDFNEISLTEKIKVKVPVHPHGEAVGVKTEGGVLDHPLWEIEIECLPTQIPSKISVEVSSMKIGDTVFVKDLIIPEGITVLTDPELTVLSVVPPAKEEAVEEAAGEEGAEPEVIAKGKKEEEEIPEAGEGDVSKKKETPTEEKKK
ncbi:MAG: 50S ribosomal protein L25 [Candidatus Omnitrophota bacterium]